MNGTMRVLLAAAAVVVLAAPPATSGANATGRDAELPTGLVVTGVVRDTHGAPVAGAGVGLCSSIDSCFDAGSAVSAGDGTFAIQPVPVGTYLLQALPPDGANLLGAWDTGAPGGSTDPGDAAPILVESDVAGREIHLPDGLRITGIVRSPGGDPVAGVAVHASGPANGSAVVTGADGAYQAVGLTSGSYTLRVHAPEGSDFPSGMVVDGVVVMDDGETSPSEVILSGADVTGQDITLSRGRSISGHLGGAAGTPVEVQAVDAPVSVRFPVASDGTFTVRGLHPGAYHLLFTVPENLGSHFPYGTYDGQGAMLADQSAEGVAVDVAGGDVSGLEAVLRTLPRLSGSIRDAGGPVAGALLNACDPERGCARAVAGADGTWSVRNVPPGSYTIQAGAAQHVVVGYAAGRSNPNPDGAIPVTVGGSSVTGINVVLPRGSSISGVVTGRGGVPLPGIDVSAGPTTGGIWEFGPGGVHTGANGGFTASGLANGTYKLAFSPPEGSPYVGGWWSTAGLQPDWSLATVIAVSDKVVPSVGVPRASIRLGAHLGTSTVPVRVTWTASDPGSNIKTNRLQQQTNAGAWATVASPVTPSADRTLTVSSTYRFRSRATDYSGNPSADRTGSTFRVLRSQQTSSAITWKGTWASRSSTSASGGSYRRASAAGASATFSFTGRSVGWVAATGPSYGTAKVYVDGTYAGSVDLHASSTSWRRVVFARAWSSSGSHTIRVVGQATPGHPSITVDAFAVLR